ncbi:type I restriction enzyme, S subunit [Mameliella alba]|uniref:restriction endonuclease subunit S n=1 Tax=Mameliella alba TaxID=561184 RepID=UPI00088B23AB|nr:restriction endonuclease subunit S [Mameliella alba]OWV49692.1 restriction endonuclease subunit S [Mameliella alba]PTR41680.1 type I restriction enzyme S subunit [Mameliella alba]GGF53557.1 hypothetical protein GCM10011319_13760 [Mameliella alba]SDC34190.1 type I restriction enzyme, S subunit [Mameliella alba]
MNAERLLDVYEQISEAPDAIARLRRFVLDLAVRGKLVEQDADDEPASTLMKAAKGLQTKEDVKIKADPLQPNETPFPAPLGWLWTRVGLIALQTGSGSTPRGGKSAYADEGTSFLRSQNIYDDGLRLDDVVFINDETNQKMKRTQVKAKDLLLNITGGSIGRCTRVPDEFAGANVSQHVAIIRTAAPGTEDYLHLLVRSPFFQEYVVGEQTGAGRGGLPKNRMDRIPVPLPPLAEQHRIVAKVDELMALCDRLEEARKTREEVRDKLTAASLARLTASDTTAEDFPTYAAFALEALPALTTRPDQIKTLRQTILNLAVRGKLVEQDPADDRDNQGLLRPDNEAESYDSRSFNDRASLFTLPEGWTIQPLSRVAERIVDCPHTTPKWTDSGVLCIKTNQVRAGLLDLSAPNFVSEETYSIRIERLTPKSDDILYIREGGILGVGCRIPKDTRLCMGQRLMLIRANGSVAPAFLELCLNSPWIADFAAEKTTGGAAPRVNMALVRGYPIPVPPLAEQHRIVAKVDTLMALCDRLEAALTTADTTRTRLLGVLLHEALDPATDTLKAAE